VAAVLLQNDKPVEFITKSKTETQQRYPQIEKELMAIMSKIPLLHVYGVEALLQ
jgi:hypothetical protein